MSVALFFAAVFNPVIFYLTWLSEEKSAGSTCSSQPSCFMSTLLSSVSFTAGSSSTIRNKTLEYSFGILYLPRFPISPPPVPLFLPSSICETSPFSALQLTSPQQSDTTSIFPFCSQTCSSPTPPLFSIASLLPSYTSTSSLSSFRSPFSWSSAVHLLLCSLSPLLPLFTHISSSFLAFTARSFRRSASSFLSFFSSPLSFVS